MVQLFQKTLAETKEGIPVSLRHSCIKLQVKIALCKKTITCLAMGMVINRFKIAYILNQE